MLLYFKKILVVFWALWWTIALFTDVTGGLRNIGWLEATWAYEANYPNLVNSLSIYPIPTWLPPALFLGIILWCLVATLHFGMQVFPCTRIKRFGCRELALHLLSVYYCGWHFSLVIKS